MIPPIHFSRIFHQQLHHYLQHTYHLPIQYIQNHRCSHPILHHKLFCLSTCIQYQFFKIVNLLNFLAKYFVSRLKVLGLVQGHNCILLYILKFYKINSHFIRVLYKFSNYYDILGILNFHPHNNLFYIHNFNLSLFFYHYT